MPDLLQPVIRPNLTWFLADFYSNANPTVTISATTEATSQFVCDVLIIINGSSGLQQALPINVPVAQYWKYSVNIPAMKNSLGNAAFNPVLWDEINGVSLGKLGRYFFANANADTGPMFTSVINGNPPNQANLHYSIRAFTSTGVWTLEPGAFQTSGQFWPVEAWAEYATLPS